MYKAFYRLTGDPFRLSPDHAFCYRYPSFAKGRAYMQYALQAAEGFVVITGAPGMGKTTLINDLLSDYGPSDYLVATMVNTMLEADDILRSAAYEFGISAEGLDTATLLQRLKQLFTQCHQDQRPPLLVVDEAQNLSLGALEELRMLTNLQFQGKPLLQIFLVGQEGLREKLQSPQLEQLRQRVTAAAHLHPLTQEQTAAYILHRLKVVGWDNFPRIKASVLPIIEMACQGVPRRINQFCSRLLLHGAVEEKGELSAADAKAVFEELSEERLSSAPANASAALQSEFVGSPEADRYSPADSHRQPVFESSQSLARSSHEEDMPPPQRALPDGPGGTPQSWQEPVVEQAESLLDDRDEAVTPPPQEALPDGPGGTPQSWQEPVVERAESLLRDRHEAVTPLPQEARPEEPGGSPQSRQEPVFANAESLLRDQRKVVMPPPQKVAAVGADERVMPTMAETFGSHADPQPRPQPKARHLRDPGFDAYGPVPETTYPRRPPRRPVVGYLVLILALLGAGAFAWYQIDRRDAMAMLSRQFDNLFAPATESAPVAAERMSGRGGATPAAADTGAK